MSDRIFVARRIHTINPQAPIATHLAVRDGRILAVGDAADAAHWGIDTIEHRFADKILLPGFVEAHSHLVEGALWALPYLGFFDRRAPDGTLFPGLNSIAAVLAALRRWSDQLPDPATPLLAWGFDPIYFPDGGLSRQALDQVSATRPLILLHASMHLIHVNSQALALAGLGRDTPIDGLEVGADGEPTGELRETTAMFALFRGLRLDPLAGAITPSSIRRFGRSGQLAGCTTLADLYANLPDPAVAAFRAVTAEDDFPVRLVSVMNTGARAPDEGIAALRGLRQFNTDKLHFGAAKVILDGSIQGFTARLRAGSYYNGAPNGLWNQSPEEVSGIVESYHRAGIQLHFHTNGDEASELALDALEAAITAHPRPDHRHTLQHAQLADAAQFQRMARLGVGANLFANHIFYWGDQHRTLTVGPERAATMDGVATALRHGVAAAIHSDAPVTPIAPLFSAWCAVNRLTASGRVLGADERIPVAESLRLITLGAAHSLHLDHLIGSIEVGKLADLAVLDADPFEVPATELKDVPVWGTVLGGRVFETPHR